MSTDPASPELCFATRVKRLRTAQRRTGWFSILILIVIEKMPILSPLALHPRIRSDQWIGCGDAAPHHLCGGDYDAITRVAVNRRKKAGLQGQFHRNRYLRDTMMLHGPLQPIERSQGQLQSSRGILYPNLETRHCRIVEPVCIFANKAGGSGGNAILIPNHPKQSAGVQKDHKKEIYLTDSGHSSSWSGSTGSK